MEEGGGLASKIQIARKEGVLRIINIVHYILLQGGG